jgi:hypothetical protein
MWRMLPTLRMAATLESVLSLHSDVSFANWLVLVNTLMALDKAACCGQMLTVGS